MALGYAAIALVADSTWMLYALMAVLGVGWASIVSLPFSIMSQRVDQGRIGLYMGVFNLSIVLPQLVVSLGIGSLISRMPDKGSIFLVCGASLLLAALAWRSVGGGDALQAPPSTATRAPH
jgi:MFS family permease